MGPRPGEGYDRRRQRTARGQPPPRQWSPPGNSDGHRRTSSTAATRDGHRHVTGSGGPWDARCLATPYPANRLSRLSSEPCPRTTSPYRSAGCKSLVSKVADARCLFVALTGHSSQDSQLSRHAQASKPNRRCSRERQRRDLEVIKNGQIDSSPAVARRSDKHLRQCQRIAAQLIVDLRANSISAVSCVKVIRVEVAMRTLASARVTPATLARKSGQISGP